MMLCTSPNFRVQVRLIHASDSNKSHAHDLVGSLQTEQTQASIHMKECTLKLPVNREWGQRRLLIKWSKYYQGKRQFQCHRLKS